jgi:hypothetical protein
MPAPITGTVFDDKNGNGTQDAGEPGLAGLTVTITEVGFLNGFTGTAVTDQSGTYSIDSTGMGATDYSTKVTINDEWNCTNGTNPNIGTIGPGSVVNFAFQPRCTRVVSSWLYKVCFLPGLGVRVTFKHHHKGLFTVLYPGTTQADYNALLAAASKGRWIHWFYAKIRPYIPWPASP